MIGDRDSNFEVVVAIKVENSGISGHGTSFRSRNLLGKWPLNDIGLVCFTLESAF